MTGTLAGASGASGASARAFLFVGGDSIAVGVSKFLPKADVDAEVGDPSTRIIARIRAGYLNTVISAGSNDSPTNPAALRRIRARTDSPRVVWILPVRADAAAAVRAVAAERGDATVAFTAGGDGIHPKNYLVLARAVAAKLLPADASEVSPPPPASVAEPAPADQRVEPRKGGFSRFLAGLAVAALAVLPGRADTLDAGGRPNDRLTPGEVRTTDRAAICDHRTAEVRAVSETTKIAARRAYGVTPADPKWCGTEGCEVDHRVPLAVGGGNSPRSIRNLWPQRPDGRHGFHVKDRCEVAVRRALCAGRLAPSQAQAIFLGDWTVGCAPYLTRKGL